MIYLLIGHRGVGKTSLLRRLEIYFENSSCDFLDLDQKIEQYTGESIPDLFQKNGEKFFRKTEIEVLLQIISNRFINADQSQKLYISLGAGFDLETFFQNKIVSHFPIKTIWVRRETDKDGRIFLDRPRLNSDISPLQEYQERFSKREQIYNRFAQYVYTLPEGLTNPNPTEKKIWSSDLLKVDGGVTLLKENILAHHYLLADFYELRSDLLGNFYDHEFASNIDLIQSVLNQIPQEKIIYSVRDNSPIPQIILDSKCRIDWDLGLSELPLFLQEYGARLILSYHGPGTEKFFSWTYQYEQLGAHFKWAPEVATFSDLKIGHDWQGDRAETRSFLPRSPDGRWQWYRLFQRNKQKLNFWRCGIGSASDQPTLYQWLSAPVCESYFAAVLGNPVRHSWSPIFHQDFFAEKKQPYYSISISEEEWSIAISILQKWGLRMASVTSPLKQLAGVISHQSQSVNTLTLRQNQWCGINTDVYGFSQLWQHVMGRENFSPFIAVWGGGGTQVSVKETLPEAAFYSSRTSKIKNAVRVASPEVLIWAAPRTPETLWPPDSWAIRIVVDLNYSENSMGLEYAQKVGAKYYPGTYMFYQQARAQQEEWKKFLLKELKEMQL